MSKVEYGSRVCGMKSAKTANRETIYLYFYIYNHQHHFYYRTEPELNYNTVTQQHKMNQITDPIIKHERKEIEKFLFSLTATRRAMLSTYYILLSTSISRF